jgi:uncharacterized protein
MSENLKAQIDEIAWRYDLQEIYVFGSRAKEVAARLSGATRSPLSPGSDIDIAVRVKPGSSLDPSQKVRITLELEDSLEASRVDLVELGKADRFLALEVIRGELLYAEDLDKQARYELYVLARAGDLAPFKKERMRMILEEGAR